MHARSTVADVTVARMGDRSPPLSMILYRVAQAATKPRMKKRVPEVPLSNCLYGFLISVASPMLGVKRIPQQMHCEAGYKHERNRQL